MALIDCLPASIHTSPFAVANAKESVRPLVTKLGHWLRAGVPKSKAVSHCHQALLCFHGAVRMCVTSGRALPPTPPFPFLRWCIPHWAFASSGSGRVQMAPSMNLFAASCQSMPVRSIPTLWRLNHMQWWEKRDAAAAQHRSECELSMPYIPGGCRELWARPGRSCVDVACEDGDQRGFPSCINKLLV